MSRAVSLVTASIVSFYFITLDSAATMYLVSCPDVHLAAHMHDSQIVPHSLSNGEFSCLCAVVSCILYAETTLALRKVACR